MTPFRATRHYSYCRCYLFTARRVTVTAAAMRAMPHTIKHAILRRVRAPKMPTVYNSRFVQRAKVRRAMMQTLMPCAPDCRTLAVLF